MKKIIYLLVLIEFFILVNAIFAHPYLISKTDSLFGEDSPEKGGKGFFRNVKNIFIDFFKINQIRVVSAQEQIIEKCCPETNKGAICESFIFQNESQCAVNLIPTKCDLVVGCEKGCCIDNKTGICTNKAFKKDCEEAGGIWKDEENCIVNECLNGCCIVDNTPVFTNERNCEILANYSGVKKDFRDINSELACLSLKNSKKEGACILPEYCSRETKEKCFELSGDFYEDYLCSHPDLDTNCVKQDSIGCSEGEDEIYWFDSCGNKENIYSANKEKSWNNGKILSKEDSCNPDGSNIESKDCGNCDRFKSSFCSTSEDIKVEDGSYVCKDLGCEYEGETYEHGESWCVYEGIIDEGRDLVGSEHWLAFCQEGEVKIERCGERRNMICSQSNMESETGDFSQANCVLNEAKLCLDYNRKKDSERKRLCNENTHCYLKEMNIDTKFSFNMCVPRYPQGFDLNSKESYSMANQVCRLASQTCTAVYKKDAAGNWKCKENCGCETPAFAQQFHKLCYSLGDCGSTVNYEGVGTNNEKIVGTSSKVGGLNKIISWAQHSKWTEPIEELYVKPQEIEFSLKRIVGNVDNRENPLTDLSDSQENIEKSTQIVNAVHGGIAMTAYGLTKLGVGTTSTTSGAQQGATVSTNTLSATNSLGVAIQSIGVAAAAFAVGATIGYFLGNSLGYQGEALMLIAVGMGTAFVAAASVVAAKFMAESLALLASMYPVGTIIAIVIAVIMIAWGFITGWGDIEERTVEFKCYPWQAPVGEQDCSACNKDPRFDCTDYRCESLGQTCKLVNEFSENPECISVPKDNNAPKINSTSVTEGFILEKKEEGRYELRGENTECITEWTPLQIILNLDESSQCKYTFTKPLTKNYEDMVGNFPQEGNLFSNEHHLNIFMPGIDSSKVFNLQGDVRKSYADARIYIRCQDYWGNHNLNENIISFCVNSGEDITPVNHQFTLFSPKNNSILKEGTNSTELKIYTNEPAECRYSSGNQSDFSLMNPMNCKNKVEQYTNQGWECNTKISLNQGVNDLYFKCKDQPWYANTTNETKRNINNEILHYQVKVSQNELKIDSISPSGIIEKGLVPASIDLNVETSGGAEDGKALCRYDFDLKSCDDPSIFFSNTGKTTHTQNFNQMNRGYYKICVKCEDIAGNTAKNFTQFQIKIDDSPPEIVTAYNSGGKLRIQTNEEALCYYDERTCVFDIANKTSMSLGLSKQHSVEVTEGKKYFIKCEDIWGNVNPDCAGIIRVVNYD